MNIDEFMDYCLSKKAVEPTFPFGEQSLVLKVAGKMFAIVSLDDEAMKVALKCEPEYALELREKYPDIVPGFHLNKKHWNTVTFVGALSERFKKQLIDHSYEMVVKSMPKKQQEMLSQNEE